MSEQVLTLNQLECLAIERYIKKYNYNLAECARALGIGRATLYRKCKQYGIPMKKPETKEDVVKNNGT
jgi:DNA-binding NtrC family response regulator